MLISTFLKADATGKKAFLIKFILVTLLLISIASAYGQDKYYYKWKQEDHEQANTAKNCTTLSSQEKQLIYYTNLLRINPSLFADTYLKEFYKKERIVKGPGYLLLVRQLKNTKPMEPLLPEEDLREVAKNHARDMGLSGKIGHLSSSIEFYADRTADLKKTYQEVRETCQYGYAEALNILGDLLIEAPLEEYDERKTLLNPNLKYVGVSTFTHTKYDFNTVMEFGGAKIPVPVMVETIEEP